VDQPRGHILLFTILINLQSLLKVYIDLEDIRLLYLMISSKGGNYKLFKGELKFQNYLDILEDKDKFTLCRFRTTNHRLPVEVGRWKQITRDRLLNLKGGGGGGVIVFF
jgi:hypothetical protein